MGVAAGEFPDAIITEARSEGSIELKLVRKPPKVSRGCGGGARAAAAARWADYELMRVLFGPSTLCPGVRGRGNGTPVGIPFFSSPRRWFWLRRGHAWTKFHFNDA